MCTEEISLFTCRHYESRLQRCSTRLEEHNAALCRATIFTFPQTIPTCPTPEMKPTKRMGNCAVCRRVEAEQERANWVGEKENRMPRPGGHGLGDRGGMGTGYGSRGGEASGERFR